MAAIDRIDRIPAHWAELRAGGVALADARGTRTWRELEDARAFFAARLRERGVRAGDRVMIVGENAAALVALLFAVASLDAWIVNLNARLSPREVDAIRDHSGAICSVFLPDASDEAAAHARRHEARPLPDAGWGAVWCSPLEFASTPEPPASPGKSPVAALVYTTGTTGEPKGVMLTHANLLFVASQGRVLRGLTQDDRVLAVLPLSHVYGLTSVCLGALLAGASLHLQARFTPAGLDRALAHDRVTICQGVPAMYAKYLEHLAAAGRSVDAPALRGIYCGGSPLSPSVKAAAESAFGLPLNNGYGLTEASPTVAQARAGAPHADCSVGPALPEVELRVVRDGNDVAAGEVGELWVRGPNVMKGYYRDRPATAAVLRAGNWLATGDLARIGPGGAVYIEGRLKELIIRSGFNVFPAEVEAVLNSHPEVSQSAVVGREVEGNEEVVAFVELVEGARSNAAAIAEFAAASLAPYKRPSEVIVLDRLPAAASGKVLKARLKELARASAPSATPAR
jgi:acyl-CoA synthetase (AMP-forming)/AMP-acid ligase II